MTSILVQWLRSKAGGLFLEDCLKADQEAEAEAQISFWEHLVRQTGKGSATLQLLIHEQDWEGLRGKLQSMYRNFCKELNRDLLYQRVRQVLHKADSSYGYQPGDNFSWYGSTDPDAPRTDSYPSLQGEGFAPLIPSLDTNALRTTQGILLLAKSFREQLASQLGADYCISLRTLCEFIRENFDVSQIYGNDYSLRTSEPFPGDAVTAQDYEQVGAWRAEAHQFMSADNLRLASNTWFNDADLQKLAQNLARQLQEQELLLMLCLRVYCELSLAQVAKAIGYASPSGIQARLPKAYLLIAQAASLYEGLGADDLNEEKFQRFMGFLLEECKEEDCSRYS